MISIVNIKQSEKQNIIFASGADHHFVAVFVSIQYTGREIAKWQHYAESVLDI